MHIATELGVPAAVAACVYLFVAFADAVRLCEASTSAFASYALLCVVAVVIIGGSEAYLLQVHWFPWILFVAVTAAARRERLRLRDGGAHL